MTTRMLGVIYSNIIPLILTPKKTKKFQNSKKFGFIFSRLRSFLWNWLSKLYWKIPIDLTLFCLK